MLGGGGAPEAENSVHLRGLINRVGIQLLFVSSEKSKKGTITSHITAQSAQQKVRSAKFGCFCTKYGGGGASPARRVREGGRCADARRHRAWRIIRGVDLRQEKRPARAQEADILACIGQRSGGTITARDRVHRVEEGAAAICNREGSAAARAGTGDPSRADRELRDLGMEQLYGDAVRDQP